MIKTRSDKILITAVSLLLTVTMLSLALPAEVIAAKPR